MDGKANHKNQEKGGVKKMWFPLKRRYSLEKEVIDPHSRWGQEGVIALKRGTPIVIEIEGEIPIPAFVFSGARLQNLTFNDLRLPEQCVIDEEGTVFCALSKNFVGIGYKRWLRPRINYCPGCGKKIADLPPFPKIKKLKMYEVKREQDTLRV